MPFVDDGAKWSPETEERIEDAALAVFSSGAGAETLAYLRKITHGRVLPPSATDAELRHLEGGRALVAIIDMRMHNARSRSAAVTAARAQPEPGAITQPHPDRPARARRSRPA